MHERFHRKALSDTDLCKGTTKAPINSTKPGATPTKEQPRSSPQPTTRTQWQGGLVWGRPTPRGGRPPTGTSRPPLALAVACLHVEEGATWTLHQDSHSTASPCINRGATPLYNTHNKKARGEEELHSYPRFS